MDLESPLKILCTGHPEKRLASGIRDQFEGHIDFASRNTAPAYDLRLDSDRKALAQRSLDYDVFINNSFVDDFVQVYLARDVWTAWKMNGKKGLIINLGSSVEDLVRPDNRLYSIGKKALRDYSKNLYLYSIWHDSGIRCTHFAFGGIQTDKTLGQWPHFSHLDITFCAQKIREVVETSRTVNVDRVQYSPVQRKDKKMLRRETPHPGLAEGEFLVAD